MDQIELNQKIKELKISADQILQEEAEMTFLDYLSKDRISSKLIFYGGTVLRLAYGSPRFSEDIDLIKIKNLKFTEFKKFINQVIIQNPSWNLKDIKNKRQTMFALILIHDDKLKHNFSLKIEIHKPANKVKLNSELLLIKSPTKILEPLLLVPILNDLKKLKLLALMNRKKARDVFDLWYISRLLKEKFILPEKLPKFNQREFKNELKVFLPTNYYPVIEQLYEQITNQNKKNT